ncbi:MAG: DUF2804 domain-containing protein [Deltaproteobacteria bacterium]|nr:DUF2804 domain-containing protein [Deltaproteobacteria bacterium]
MRGCRFAAILGLAASLGALAGCDDAVQQHEITAAGELLTPGGRLREPGWSRRELLRWDASRVHDPGRLRAWDFFTLQNDQYAAAFTLFDLGFIQLASVTVVDFATGQKFESRNLGGVLALSTGVEGSQVASYRADAASPAQLAFSTTPEGSTEIQIALPALFGPAASGSIRITRRPGMPYLALATPFADDPTNFFYEQKLPGLGGAGFVTVDGRSFAFDPTTTVASMDWGRGQWPAEVTWRWAAGATSLNGVPLGFNLGEGFGDPSHGSENFVSFGDAVSKFGTVRWSFDRADPLRPWTLRSSDGRLSLVLSPVAPETGGLDLGDKYNLLHKAYGTWSGSIELDDGQTVQLQGVRGFAEEMQLSW